MHDVTGLDGGGAAPCGEDEYGVGGTSGVGGAALPGDS